MYNRLAIVTGTVLSLFCAGTLAAGQKDTLDVTALTDSLGFSPTIPGNAQNQWFYAITAPNSSVADVIPVQFALNDTNGTSESSPYTVTLNAVGPLAAAISFDNASFSISDGQSVTDHINLNTTQLAPGDYIANVQVKATPQSGVTIPHDTIHILLHLAAPGSYTCFLTDSAGLLLQDCGGQSVTTGGAFSIVTNAKKVVVSTNPGQFYYNLLWTNTTGSDQTLTFTLSGANVVPVGANSVHVLVYDANQFTYDFDDVNQIGKPCGQTGSTCASITVPSGQTLWLTWHVAYQWIGSPIWSDIPNASACPTTSAHGTITMSILAENADDSVSILCTTSANGYRK